MKGRNSSHDCFLLWDLLLWIVSIGYCGSTMSWSSWSSSIISSIFISRTLVPLGSSTSSIGSFLYLDYVESPSNVASLLMSIFFNIRNYIQYAFEVLLYPTNIYFIPKGSSLVLFSFGMYTRQAIILRWPWLLVSLMRKNLQESFFWVLDEEYGYVHTYLSLFILPKGSSEDPGHVSFLSLLSL